MRSLRVLLGSTVAGVLVLLTGAPATAHASLISSDPGDGSVVATLPEEIVLTFNESIRLGSADAVRGFAPDGGDWAVESEAQDNRVVVTPVDDPGTGTVVLSWRVTSEDGHEVAGAVSFAIGDATATPGAGATAAAAADPPLSVEVARWAALGATVAALVGLVAVSARVLLRPLPAGWSHRGLHHALTGLWYAAFLGALLWVPLAELARQGRGLSGLGDWLVWLDGLTDPRGWLLLAAVLVAIPLVHLAREASRPGHRSHRATALGAGTTVVLGALVAGFAVVPAQEQDAVVVPAAAEPAAQQVSADLGTEGTVELSVTSAEGRRYRIDVRLSDPAGAALRPYAEPVVGVANDEVDLGEPALRRTGPGEYRTVLTIPRDGDWTVRVSVRIDEFTNPVADVAVVVG